MGKLLFTGDYKNSVGTVKVNLILVHFKDDNDIDLVYSPHLDLSGSGYTLEEAKKSFEIALEDLFDYTLKKKTLGKLLTKLGWEIKGTVKRPKKIKAPSISTLMRENDYVSEIFDNYNVSTFHQEVSIPAIV